MESRYMTDLEWRICHAVNIYLFKNGNDMQTPVLVHIPPSRKKNMQSVMDTVQERVSYPVGYAKTLYTMDGKKIRHPCELEMYNNYVVASNFEKSFKCVEYGRKRPPLLVLNRYSKHIRVLRLQNENYDQWLRKKREMGSERPQYVFPERYIHEGILPQDLPVDRMGNTYVPNCNVDPNESNYAEKHGMRKATPRINQKSTNNSVKVNAFTVEQDPIEEYLQHAESIEDTQEQDEKHFKKLGPNQVFYKAQEKWRTKGALEKNKDDHIPLFPTASDMSNANFSAYIPNCDVDPNKPNGYTENHGTCKPQPRINQKNTNSSFTDPIEEYLQQTESNETHEKAATHIQKLEQDSVFYQPQEKWKRQIDTQMCSDRPQYVFPERYIHEGILPQDLPVDRMGNTYVPNCDVDPNESNYAEKHGMRKATPRINQKSTNHSSKVNAFTIEQDHIEEYLHHAESIEDAQEQDEKHFKKLGPDQVFYKPQEKWRTKGVLEKNKDDHIPLFPTASNHLNANFSAYIPNCDVDPNKPNDYAENTGTCNPQPKINQKNTNCSFTDPIEEYLQQTEPNETHEKAATHIRKLEQDSMFYQPQDKWKRPIDTHMGSEHPQYIFPERYIHEGIVFPERYYHEGIVFPERYIHEGIVFPKRYVHEGILPQDLPVDRKGNIYVPKLGPDQVFYKPQEKLRTKGILEKTKDDHIPLFPTASTTLSNRNVLKEKEEEIEDIAEVEEENYCNELEEIEEVDEDYDGNTVTVTVSMHEKKGTPNKKEKRISFSQKKPVKCDSYAIVRSAKRYPMREKCTQTESD